MPVSPWITEARLVADHPGTSYADGAAAEGIQLASEVLYHLSGRRFPGEQTDTIRPHCRHAHWLPSDQRFYCTGAGGMIRLPGTPVISRAADPEADPPVEASPVVTLDGVAFTEFRVYDRRFLARTDGASWPCQASPTYDDPPTVEVTYAWGRNPTAGGMAAASALAHEYAVALSPDIADTCALPPRVVSVVRQGVTVSVSLVGEEGRTGLPAADDWLDALRYGDHHAGAALVVPGAGPRYRRVQ
jgi:hypothetical protein